MADLPFAPANAGVASRLRAVVDPDDKIVHAIEALGPVAGRDVVMLGHASVLARGLRGLGSRVTMVAPPRDLAGGNGVAATDGAGPVREQAGRAKRPTARARGARAATAEPGTAVAVPGATLAVPSVESAARSAPETAEPAIVEVVGTPTETGLAAGSTDVVVVSFQVLARPDAAVLAEADRILRPDGRLLVVADYGRDDLDPLRDPGERAALVAASRPNGWFLASGFRIRVIHAWWVFDDRDAAGELLQAAFGDAAQAVVATMKRPRLAHKVAIFHRTRGNEQPAASGAPAGPKD